MIKFSETKLASGLRVILAPMQETKTVSVLVLVGAGSRYEEKEENGLSHFLEHMFFKGTKRRPSTLKISQELDAVGANYNAFTSDEDTGFFVRTEATHLNLSLDVLSDMLFNSKFAEAEIAKEKGVISEEINMYQDVPQQYVQDLTKFLFYGDTSLGRSVLGTKNIVAKFTRDNFITYKNSLYCPKNMILVIAGCIKDKKNLFKTIKNKFPQKNNKLREYVKVQNIQNKPQNLVYFKNTDQAHLVLGFRSYSRYDKRRPTLKVLNNILGDTMSSRLFTEVREKRGLAYYVSSDYLDFYDTGMLVASAGVDLARADQAIKVILDEFRRLKTSPITSSELNKAKENIKGRLYLGLEDSLSVASFLAEQELFWGDIKSPEQLISEINKVQVSDILKLAREMVVAGNLNLAIIGPFKDKKRFEKILKI